VTSTSFQRIAPGERMRRNVFLVGGLAAVLLGTAVCAKVSGSKGPPSAMQELARLRPQRTFAPRLSIPTTYHDCTAHADSSGTVPRETCGTRDEESPDLGALAQVGESTDPDSLQASGLAAIIWHDEQNPHALDEAIMRLNKALRLSTRRVPLLVDLSAAHLVRAARTQNPRDLWEASDYAHQALALEPRNARAQFNVALALETAFLDEEAVRAWDAYLAIDSTSRWAAEAKQRRGALTTKAPEIAYPAPGASTTRVDSFAAHFPQEAREYGWNRILAVWGATSMRGDSTEAASQLDLAERLGHALERRAGGDRSLAEAVRAIRRAQSRPAATLALARAHQDYAAAQAHGGQMRHDSAYDALIRIERVGPASPVLLQWTELHRAIAVGYLGKIPEADRAVRTLLSQMDGTRDPVLLARARMFLGTLQLRSLQHDSASADFHSAELHFRRAGEMELNAAVWSAQGELAYQQGDTVSAYKNFHRAHRELRAYRQSIRLRNHLHGLARATLADGMPRAALPVSNEDVLVTERLGIPILVLDALQGRSHVRRAIGDHRGTDRDLDAAFGLVSELATATAQQKWAVSALRTARPGTLTASAMDSAVDVMEENVLWLVPALQARARLHAAAGDLVRATQDVERVIEQTLGLARQTADARRRGALLEQARSSFDALVMLNLSQGRPADGLRALERGRLSLAPWRAKAPVGDGPLTAPPGQTAVEYALIGDTLLVWTIRGDTIRVLGQPMNRDTFMLTVDRVVAALESPAHAASATPGLRRLYDWLIRPVQGYLGPAETPLVILADGEVAGVPFAALLDSSRERYLIQDYPLRFAATLAEAARPASPRARAGRALLVADPAFDLDQYPMLRRLPGARTEVGSVLGLYRDPLLLMDSNARRNAFVILAQSASMIHYAGHAVFDDARPERSYLVLAGADTTGRLTAEAVGEMQLGGVRLVILSACRTTRSREGRSGGVAGLTGALLSAGAGGVVGSLWQVNDKLTAPLMQAFHQEHGVSHDPAGALRDAQLRMLSSADTRFSSPAAWAAFRYTGAEQP
jgi:CHAT domain-containing protein/tetratricopeptide (TPR) repeat protein